MNFMKYGTYFGEWLSIEIKKKSQFFFCLRFNWFNLTCIEQHPVDMKSIAERMRVNNLNRITKSIKIHALAKGTPHTTPVRMLQQADWLIVLWQYHLIIIIINLYLFIRIPFILTRGGVSHCRFDKPPIRRNENGAAKKRMPRMPTDNAMLHMRATYKKYCICIPDDPTWMLLSNMDIHSTIQNGCFARASAILLFHVRWITNQQRAACLCARCTRFFQNISPLFYVYKGRCRHFFVLAFEIRIGW